MPLDCFIVYLLSATGCVRATFEDEVNILTVSRMYSGDG